MAGDNFITRMKAFLREHMVVFGTICGVLGTIGGYWTSDFIAFRSDNRAVMSSQYDRSQEVANEVIVQLQDYLSIAQGKNSKVGEADLQAFKTNLLRLYGEAKGVVDVVPELKPEFDKYADSMVRLKKEAGIIVDLKQETGRLDEPLDGKEFYKASIAFIESYDEFSKKYAKLHGSYF